MLLQADDGREDEASAEAVGTRVATSERTRPRCGERHLDARNELPGPGGSPQLSGKQEAQLSAGAVARFSVISAARSPSVTSG